VNKNLSFFDLLFEAFSAFNTVGLSTGITADLSISGQIVLMLSMFFGRTGTILVAFMITNNQAVKSYTYPSAHIIVG
jgi:trk system potassium uptake protein TrkH